MKKLLRQYESGKTTAKAPILRKRWVAILAAVIMAITMAMSVSAVRQTVYQFVSEVYEKYSQIFFSQSSSSSQAGSHGFEAYIPSYIPEGFKLVNKEKNDMLIMEYDKGKDFISYSQEPIENVSAHINTEGVKIKNMEVHGLHAKYYSNQGIQNIIWYDDNYMYVVSSTLDQKTVLKIAESVQIKKK